MKTLSTETIIDNARFFKSENEVPSTCLTVGVKTVYNAREIIIMANGFKKSMAVKECVEGCISN